MSIVDFHYRYRNPYVAAVQWTGTNRDQILEFVQLVCIEGMGWDYKDPREVVAFMEDDGYGGNSRTLQFDNGLEVDEGQWIVQLTHGNERYLDTARDAYMRKLFEKQP